MENIIEVKNLSKKFRIYHQKEKYKTLVDEITKSVKKPLRFLRGQRQTKEDFWALKDISFNVKPGEALGIIGPNGAGKTTLLKILSQITPPTEGEAVLRGRIGSLLAVGTGFHPELTGRENIYLNGSILGMTKREIDKKFDEIVEFAEVEKFLDTQVKRYSSGMSVRLAFAIAAHLDPEILLIDEVLAVGDAEFQRKCLGKMDEVKRNKGKTILFVSHNMASVITLCPRTILLDSGRILMDAPTSDVVEFYMGLRKEKGSEITWKDPKSAPGDDEVRLQGVCLLSEDGKPIFEVGIEKDVLVEVSYWNLKEGAELFTSIHLVNGQDVSVLTSFNGPSASLIFDPWYEKPRQKGLFRSVCRIPGNFLNEGFYFVDIYVVGHHSGAMVPHVVAKRIISFDVIETGAMRGEQIGKWVGVVRPRLAWNTEYLEPLNEGKL